MGVLYQQSKVNRYILPSTKHLPEEQREWVDMDVSKSNTTDIEHMGSQVTEVQAMLHTLVNRIKAWSYTDVQGQACEINYDTMRLIQTEDFVYLGNVLKEEAGLGRKAAGLSEAEKKA